MAKYEDGIKMTDFDPLDFLEEINGVKVKIQYLVPKEDQNGEGDIWLVTTREEIRERAVALNLPLL